MFAKVRSMRKWASSFIGEMVGPVDPRDQIIEALDDTMAQSRGRRFIACAIVIDIDNYATLAGSQQGDDLSTILHVLTGRLKGGLLARDMVRRLEGGRFAVALSPLRDISDDLLRDLARNIQTLIQDPIIVENNQTHLTASIGYAMSPHFEACDGRTILEAARIAVMDATEQGRASVLAYTNQMGAAFQKRREMVADIRRALDTGEITAFFQPQICLTTNEISGFEALARWRHVTHGMVPPVEFLPILEQAGLMRDLGMAMLRDALKALKNWDEAGMHVPCVSINMSAVELRNPHLVDCIKMELDAYGLPASRLVVEVLETVVAGDNDDLIVKNLDGLSKLGCPIDLDDFGTGHASITTIRKFAVNRIKIDRTFVTAIDVDTEQQQMVSAILMIAEKLSVETLAEGAETSAEISHLMHAGCGHVQGFGIAKPLPRDETTAWIKNWQPLGKPRTDKQIA